MTEQEIRRRVDALTQEDVGFIAFVIAGETTDAGLRSVAENIAMLILNHKPAEAADKPERFDSAAYFASLESDAVEGRTIVVSPAMARRAGFDAADYRKLAAHLANGSITGLRRVVAVPYPR